jgi:hypothetical protein
MVGPVRVTVVMFPSLDIAPSAVLAGLAPTNLFAESPPGLNLSNRLFYGGDSRRCEGSCTLEEHDRWLAILPGAKQPV